MPRKFRHGKARFDILSDDQRQKLFFDFDFGHRVFIDDEEARECWEQFREQLMTEWFEKEPAGTRPWGWWRFDAPTDERRRLGGVGTESRERADCPAWALKVSYGMPGVFDSDYDPDNPPRFESEVDYLRRHKLLTRREERLLADRARQPATQPGTIVPFNLEEEEDDV